MKNDEYTQLIESAVSGDMSGFEKLIILNYQFLHRYVACKISRFHDREDVMQEILIITWMRLNTLRKPESFKAWLIAIASNCCKNYYKKNSKLSEPTEHKVLFYAIDRQLRTDDAGEIRNILEYEIGNLPKAQKNAMMDFYYKDLKIKEISFIRGIPEGTVKRRLHDGRKTLKKRLEEEDE